MSLASSVMSSAVSEDYLCFSSPLMTRTSSQKLEVYTSLASSVMYLRFFFRLDHGEDFIRDTEGIRVFSRVQCDVFCSAWGLLVFSPLPHYKDFIRENGKYTDYASSIQCGPSFAVSEGVPFLLPRSYEDSIRETERIRVCSVQCDVLCSEWRGTCDFPPASLDFIRQEESIVLRVFNVQYDVFCSQ